MRPVVATLVTILAAIGGSVLTTFIVFHTFDRFSFLPVLFSLPGALLLSFLYAHLKGSGYHPGVCYIALLAAGGLVGGFILMFGSSPSGLVGALYGFVTAGLWVTLHAATTRLRR